MAIKILSVDDEQDLEALLTQYFRRKIRKGEYEFSFAHKDKLCSPFQKRVPDPTAPYDAYDESDDTEEAARAGYLQAVVR
jgi:hypothetical protein